MGNLPSHLLKPLWTANSCGNKKSYQQRKHKIQLLHTCCPESCLWCHSLFPEMLNCGRSPVKSRVGFLVCAIVRALSMFGAFSVPESGLLHSACICGWLGGLSHHPGRVQAWCWRHFVNPGVPEASQARLDNLVTVLGAVHGGGDIGTSLYPGMLDRLGLSFLSDGS